MKIGIIGTGNWGSKIINELKHIPEVNKIVLCNNHGKYNYKDIYNDYQKMITKERPDGIIVAACPGINKYVAKYCNFYNIPIMLEKPVCLKLSDWNEINKLSIPILVNYLHLLNNQYRKMKEQLIGKKIIRIGSLGYGNGPVRNYSSLLDYGSHDLALIFDLLPEANKLEIIQYQATEMKEGRQMHKLHLQSEEIDINILSGNDRTNKARKLVVFCSDGDQFNIDFFSPIDLVLHKQLQYFVEMCAHNRKDSHNLLIAEKSINFFDQLSKYKIS